VVCALAANFFGDRWTYLQISGYMWVLGGLVSRSLVLEREDAAATEAVGEAQAESGMDHLLGVGKPQVAGVV
jgi:hypothetical protein